MEIKKEIEANQITLVIIDKTSYIEKLPIILREVEGISKKICYVTLNKPFNSIIINLGKLGIPADKFYFIDVLTATIQTPPQVDNCTFVESPNAITDLSLSFTKAITERECDNAIFDSISTLIVHHGQAGVIKLSQNLMTKIRVLNKKAVFICLKEDSDTLVKDLTMFVDGIINL